MIFCYVQKTNLQKLLRKAPPGNLIIKSDLINKSKKKKGERKKEFQILLEKFTLSFRWIALNSVINKTPIHYPYIVRFFFKFEIDYLHCKITFQLTKHRRLEKKKILLLLWHILTCI